MTHKINNNEISNHKKIVTHVVFISKEASLSCYIFEMPLANTQNPYRKECNPQADQSVEGPVHPYEDAICNLLLGWQVLLRN
ncbi:hypothetical protein D1164_13970 [Mariniphaga sediminis]|uniref:Uncharacterized protein n=1 Tax=Mariniphaga sediminis TaxID=1628158 RepID=A0A399CZ91_9BACT|nr:hypothetical protein D1164_13970 [Mariniphaga sediminis]